VWVIDTKRYKGKLQVAKPLFGKPTLKVGGRDQTKLVDGLAKHVELVMVAVADDAPDIAVLLLLRRHRTQTQAEAIDAARQAAGRVELLRVASAPAAASLQSRAATAPSEPRQFRRRR
jgi:hypothetical protein